MTGEGAKLAELSAAVRESTLKRLRLVPLGRENWRPVDGALSFAEIAQHVVECDEWLFRKLDDPELHAIKARAGSVTVAGRAQFRALLDRLAVLGDHRRDLLASLTDAQLDARIPDDRFGGEVTVWWVIVRGNLDHEAHHRGQLAAYLRILASQRSAAAARSGT